MKNLLHKIKIPEGDLLYIDMWITLMSQIVRSKDDEQNVISCDDFSMNGWVARGT